MVVERNCCPVSIVRSTVIDQRLMAVEAEVGLGGSYINTMEEALEEVAMFLRNDVPSEVEAVFDSETGALITFLLPFDEGNELDDRRMEISLEEATPVLSVPHGMEEAQAGCPDTSFHAG